MEVPDAMVDVLVEFVDMMPPELPRALSLRHTTNYHRVTTWCESPSEDPLQNGITRVSIIEETVNRATGCRINPAIEGTIWSVYAFSKEVGWVPSNMH